MADASVPGLSALDPAQMPRWISLDLDPIVVSYLERQSAATGRCIDELVLQVLDRALQADRSPS
jgi:hypothetical protein